MKYLKSIIYLVPVTMMFFASCVGDLDVDPIDPNVTTEFDQDGVFAKIYATMALTGNEGPAGHGDVDGIDEGTSAFYRLLFTINEYPTDEVLCSWNDPGIPEMNYISWNSSHSMLTGLYARFYFDVTLCNHFLEMTEGQTDDNSIKQRAEARFMRALNYYYLMDIFGNVPFVEKVSNENPHQLPRAELFAYIEKELEEIEADMYNAQQAPYGRADKVANWLLRSRMYLNAEIYTGTAKWAEAATYAKKVMDSSYKLAPVYAHLFMADNDGSSVNMAKQEIILPISQDGVKTISYGGSVFLIASTRTGGMTSWGSTEGWGGLRARKALVRKFFPNDNAPLNGDEKAIIAAANDDRALFYVNGDRTLEITDPNTFKEGFSIVKWTNLRADGKSANHAQWTDTDIPFMRAAEAYLTYAEATLRSGGSTAEALSVVNQLRARANATPLPSISLDQILDEKAREFFFEGQRRTDLIRYGYFTSNRYLWDWKGNAANGTSVSSFYNICPIPDSDLNVNENLVQNPGY